MFADRCVHVNRNPGVGSEKAEAGTAKSKYREFHHKDAAVTKVVDVPDIPEDAYVLGYCYTIGYIPFGSSGKEHERFIHEFGDTGYSKDTVPEHAPLLLADGKDNLFLARGKSKYYINERGIVG